MVKSSNHQDFLDELFLIPRTSGVVLFVEEDCLNGDVVSGEEEDEEDERKISEFCAIFARSEVKSF